MFEKFKEELLIFVLTIVFTVKTFTYYWRNVRRFTSIRKMFGLRTMVFTVQSEAWKDSKILQNVSEDYLTREEWEEL